MEGVLGGVGSLWAKRLGLAAVRSIAAVVFRFGRVGRVCEAVVVLGCGRLKLIVLGRKL